MTKKLGLVGVLALAAMGARPAEALTAPPKFDGTQVTFTFNSSAHLEFPSVTYSYRLAIEPSSAQPVQMVAVEVHSPTTGILTPPGWRGNNTGDVVPLWLWIARRRAPLASGNSVQFENQSQGLPSVSTAFVQGLIPIPWVDEEPEGVSEEDFDEAIGIYYNSVRRVTLGPAATTTSSSLTEIATFLATQPQKAADAGWITQPGVLQSFQAKLNAAVKSIVENHMTAAQGQMHSVENEARAQEGKAISPEAAEILEIGAEAFLAQSSKR